jgi:hypothetical protein
MQPRSTRSPWFQLTKALLATSDPLRNAGVAGQVTGWRHFGAEVSGQVRRYLEEFYEVPVQGEGIPDELAPLVEQFRGLAMGAPAPLLKWISEHLPEVLAGADDKQRKEFAAGVRDGGCA